MKLNALNMTLGVIVGIFGTVTPFVYGFEIASEYIGLDEDEQESVSRAQNINAEYQSDYLTFIPHPREEKPFFAGSSFLAGAGSLGSRDFLIRQDLSVRAPFMDDFEVRMRHFYSSDFEDKIRHQFLEFVKWRGEWGFALFGQPLGEKKRMDAGFALLHRPQEKKESRFYIAFPDFQRNERNDEMDRFLQAPIVLGWRYESAVGEDGFQRIQVRNEFPVRWRFPDTQSDYRFERRFFSYFIRRSVDEGGYENFRMEWRTKKESQWPYEMTSPVTGVELSHARALAFYSRELSSHELGLMASYRKWHDVQDYKVIFYQPFVWCNWRRVGRSLWRVGGELTIPEVHGRLSGVQPAARQTEARINVEWSRRIRQNENFIALLTFDGDDLLSSEAWEGGSVRLAISF